MFRKSCSANAVENYHRLVRKFTKSKAIFPTDDSIRKVIFMSVKEISKKWTMPVRDWGLAYQQFAIYFQDRFAACVGSILSVTLLAVILVFSKFWRLLRLHSFICSQ